MLCPVVWNPKAKRDTPLTDVFNDIMSLLSQDDANAKKLRKKLLGDTPIKSAPEEYWRISMLKNMGVSLSEWEALPIHDRAKYRAQYYLNNMVEIVKAHYEEKQRATEAAIRKAQDSNTKSAPKSNTSHRHRRTSRPPKRSR